MKKPFYNFEQRFYLKNDDSFLLLHFSLIKLFQSFKKEVEPFLNSVLRFISKYIK